MTYTPRPWRIGGKHDPCHIFGNDHLVAQALYWSGSENAGEVEANARLIVAAPDLLEALKVSALMLSGTCQHGYDTSKSARGCDKCAEQIEAAIRAAEGE